MNGIERSRRVLILIGMVLVIVVPFIINSNADRNQINSAERFCEDLENIVNKAISTSPYNERRNIEQPDNIVSIMTQGVMIKVTYTRGGWFGEKREGEITMDFSGTGIKDIELSGFMIGKGTYEIHVYQTPAQIIYIESNKIS